jgi:hypothetical protein
MIGKRIYELIPNTESSLMTMYMEVDKLGMEESSKVQLQQLLSYFLEQVTGTRTGFLGKKPEAVINTVNANSPAIDVIVRTPDGSKITWQITGTPYNTTSPVNLVLDAPEVNPRFDLIYLGRITSQTPKGVYVRKGQSNETPVKPGLNTDELEIGFVYVSDGELSIDVNNLAAVIYEIRDYYTVKQADINQTTLQIPLRYAIAPKTHVIVEVNNDMLKNDFETPANQGVYIYTEGNNYVTLLLDRMFYKLEAGWRITVYYSYLKPSQTADPVNVVLQSLTHTITGGNNVNVEYVIKNNGTKDATISVTNQLNVWSQPETLSITIAAGGTATRTKTFPSVMPGTYTFNLSGNVSGQITNIIIPALVADIVFDALVIGVDSFGKYKFSNHGVNNGSTLGTVSVKYEIYEVASHGANETAPSIGTVTTPSYTLNPAYSQLFEGLSNNAFYVGFFKVKAYRTDTNALIGTGWFDVSADVPAPIPFYQAYDVADRGYILNGPTKDNINFSTFIGCYFSSGSYIRLGVLLLFNIPNIINVTVIKLCWNYDWMTSWTKNLKVLKSLANPITGLNVWTQFVDIDLHDNLNISPDGSGRFNYELTFNSDGISYFKFN